MPESEPLTQAIELTDACEHWSPEIDAVSQGKKRVVFEEAGVPVAALVSAQDLARLRRLDAQQAVDMELVRRFGEAFAGIPDEELEREVALAVEEARAELRAEREQAQRRQ